MKQNFRTLAAILAAATIAVFTASCTKENLDTTNVKTKGVERTINATAAMPQGGDKAYLDYDDSRKVKWELTDALNINGTNIALSSLNADPTRAQFSGTAYAISSGSNDIYWAVYPTTLTGAASGNNIPGNFTASTLTVNFPATQTYDASANALSGNTYMAGYASVPSSTENIVFQMRNIGTVLKLSLTADASATNKHASRIEFTTTNGALAGDFTVNNNTTDPTVTATATTTQTLTVNLTDGTNNYIDLSTAKDIYVILPPFASKDLTMKVFNTDDGKSTKTVSAATMERNKIYTNTASDLCFCECGDGSPYFTISDAGDKVVFAPGNLQYQASTGTWRFAANQWDYIGNAAGNTTARASRATQADWIDLFGWGTSGYDNTTNDPYAVNFQPWATSTGDVNTTYNYYGYGPSINMTDVNLTGTSANYDWGVYKAIGDDPAGTWRTLTNPEWVYILNTRITCSGVRYAKATVNGVAGLIIVPDNWDNTTNTLNSTNTANADFTTNTISSAADWTNIYEAAGCAFLPAAGYRHGITVNNAGTNGYYQSASNSTDNTSGDAYNLYFYSGGVNPYTSHSTMRVIGRSVRLVKEVN